MTRVLVAGESWMTHSVHVKGVDSFTTSSYTEGADDLRGALVGAGIEVDYLPGHLVPTAFPASPPELAAYDVVVLSDIGANSLLLSPDTFERSQPTPDRLAAIVAFVRAGGGLLMIGGYLSFAGIDGKARYHATPVEAALPVVISALDDRVEVPQGVIPAVRDAGHPVLRGVPEPWPALLGYNALTARAGSSVLVTCGTDPLLVCGEHGAGRGAAFASDCAPHWGPPAFLTWAGYAALWANLVQWLAASR